MIFWITKLYIVVHVHLCPISRQSSWSIKVIITTFNFSIILGVLIFNLILFKTNSNLARELLKEKSRTTHLERQVKKISQESNHFHNKINHHSNGKQTILNKPKKPLINGWFVDLCYEYGIDYPENDIDSVASVDNASECQNLCQEIDSCNYWTYNTNTKVCLRKRAKSNQSVISHATSGPQYCGKPL